MKWHEIAINALRKGWCKGQITQDEQGRYCPYQRATRFTLWGALLVGTHGLTSPTMSDLWKKFEKRTGLSPLAWNDTVCKDVAMAVEQIHLLRLD